MKYLHVFTKMNYVYTEALIRMFVNNLEEYEHIFLICDIKQNVPNSIKNISDNIEYLDSNKYFNQAKKIVDCSKKSDYTIFHFLPNNVFLHLLLLFDDRLCSKYIWRIWGADLYNWKKRGIKGLLFNLLRGATRERIHYIIAEPMDIPVVKRQFISNKTFLEGPDPKGYDITKLESNRTDNRNGKFTILLGHSAVAYLNHIMLLEKLAKYKEENIQIVIPLNYGNARYAEEVEKKALDIFEDSKILIIKKKMSLDEYIKLLWTCDMSIIHTDRQIAMGNITMLLYMKKKIFLKSESILDKFYRIDNGLDIFDSNSIGKLSYDELCSACISDKNQLFAEHEIDISWISSRWEKTFDFFENKEN